MTTIGHQQNLTLIMLGFNLFSMAVNLMAQKIHRSLIQLEQLEASNTLDFNFTNTTGISIFDL
jgi:hypothetical protein